ncbi:MAG: hypothetical protein CVV27_05700 [Candidatus Melainabacteria bacterium HGW-Melainabacteria-1]|nr:MAG: hypothetical protein CVV27_05700 [Candidatus Melainabacteria bacterium HGW-Melainabacteria-1]
MNKSTFGYVLIGISLFMLMGFFKANLAPMVAFMTFLFAVVLPAGGGGYLIYEGLRQKKALSGNKANLGRKTLEAEILNLARANQGRLTVVEVVSRFAIDKEEAEALLDSLAQQRHADYEVTDSGLIVYTFHELQRLGDKSQARSIEDA